MENPARLFICAHCRCQVVICSHCDRGNIYCGKPCAEYVRRISLRAAGRRYQDSYQGRLKHAERQRRYRLSVKVVTHQGSPPPSPSVPLSPPSKAAVTPAASAPGEGVHCYFCARLCSPFQRLNFLHRRPTSSAFDRDVIHRSRQYRAQAP